jgi:hypothetical protein
VRAFKATFTKKSGELRTITFAKVEDLPKGYLPESKGGKINLVEGMELVWDLENKGYRVFNNKTIIGKIEEFETQI